MFFTIAFQPALAFIFIFSMLYFIKKPLILILCFCGGQVVAITVYFLLVVAFYAFFSPFLGKDLYEYVAIAVYSTVVSTLCWEHIIILCITFLCHQFISLCAPQCPYFRGFFRLLQYLFSMLDAQLSILLILEY